MLSRTFTKLNAPLRALVPRATGLPLQRYLSSSAGSKPVMPEFSLSGRVYAITGAGRGLGLTMADALLDAGAASVYALDVLPKGPEDDFKAVASAHHRETGGFKLMDEPNTRKTPKNFSHISKDSASEGLAENLSDFSSFPSAEDMGSQPGSRLVYMHTDVTSEESLKETFERIGKREGRLDGLIGAAGVILDKRALDVTKEEWDTVFAVNSTGAFLSAKHAALTMLSYNEWSPASILLVASMSGMVVNKHQPYIPYNASKCAVLQISRSLAAELGPQQIRVNSLSPGHTKTRMTKFLIDREPRREKDWAAANMLGRVGMPEDFRAIAVFMMGDGSRYMTGSNVVIDGGHTGGSFRAITSGSY